MVRLKDIPKEKLEEIAEFVRKMKGKIPVTSKGGKSLVDLVEEKFGYRLSPQQIYALQKGYRTYRIKLDVDTIIKIEEEFGDVSKGIKQLLKFYREQTTLPDHLKKPHKALLEKGEELTIDDIKEVLLGKFAKDEREMWNLVAELCKLGYIRRIGNKFYIYKFRRDPLLEFFLG